MSYGRPVWAEIDLSAIRRNIDGVKSLLAPTTKFCAVVKADGYGHGATAVAREAVAAGADYLAVAIVDEALSLRAAGFTQPILILGYTPPAQAPLVSGAALTQTIFNVEQAEALAAAGAADGRPVKVHLKIDSGMGRLGVPPGEAADFAARVAALPGLMTEGVFTHFATADSRDKSYARKQFAEFSAALEALRLRGLAPPIRHCANSAAALDMPETRLDMARCGIILYGLKPSEETGRPFELKPAMRLKARIALLKDVPAGACLSYGCAYVTSRPARIATLPLGYADGWTRMLSGRGTRVLIGGRPAEVVGRICMDQCLVDVSGLEGVREGDEALMFGGDELPVDETAARLGTINYEIVCMVGKRVPRQYVRA
jgi:alanine racemase